MRRLVFTLALMVVSLISLTSLAQIPAVKGHHINETFLEFIKTENAGPKLVECDQLLADPKIAKRIQKDFLAKLQFDSCTKIAEIVRTGNGELGAGEIGMSVPGNALFLESKLVRMELDFWNLPTLPARYSFDSVLHDLSDKFGTPSRTWTEEFQNGFGARFSYRRVSWSTKELIVFLSELQNDSSTAIVEDRARAEKSIHDSEASHKNVLDR